MIICTFILAFLSWQYVEKPFRNKIKFDRASVFRYSAVSFVLFMTVGVVGAYNNGFEQRFNVSSYAASIEHSPKREKCHASTINPVRPINACKYFGTKITWAVYGDSHAVELAYALARKLEPDDIGLVHLSFGGCPPALLYEVKLRGCTKWINESLEYLENDIHIENVLLSFRHSLHLFGDHIDTYPNLPNVDLSESFTDSFRESVHEDSKIIYWRSFKEIISRLQKAGKKIYILYPIPEPPIDINKAVLPFSIFGDSTVLDLERATSAEFYFNRNKFILSKLDTLPFGDNLHAINPFEILCNGNYCPVVKGNKALYYDVNHPSIYGAVLIIERIDLGEASNKTIH
jgi:SGNH domain (fused to AT3 domains)